jgi:hypothetical protein
MGIASQCTRDPGLDKSAPCPLNDTGFSRETRLKIRALAELHDEREIAIWKTGVVL